MFQLLTNFLKMYNKKLLTVITFIVVWTCVLIIFNNQITLDVFEEAMKPYPVEEFEKKICELSSYQSIKLKTAKAIAFTKVLYFIYNFFK